MNRLDPTWSEVLGEVLYWIASVSLALGLFTVILIAACLLLAGCAGAVNGLLPR